MKKQLTVALGLAVLATPAFATKARLQALGEDSYGSQYINDNRNIWLNAAQINNHKDLVTYEFGKAADEDSAATARGEGGVYKTMGNLVFGVHFGGASNSANQFRAAGGMVTANAATESVEFNGSEENNIDVFVGGDAGIKWGANLGYAKTEGAEGEGRYGESLRTRLGVIAGDFQAYANVNLVNYAKGEIAADVTDLNPGMDMTGTSKFEGKLGYQVGAIQAWQGNTVFVDYRSFDMESTLKGNAFGSGAFDEKEDISVRQFEAGIGRVERLNDKTNLFTKVSYFQRNLENDHGKRGGTLAVGCALNDGFCQSFDQQRVPVVVGVETEANSWLTVRASVVQSVWGTQEVKDQGEKTESGLGETTTLNAGVTLKFGELSVDGFLDNNENARVGMTYRF